MEGAIQQEDDPVVCMKSQFKGQSSESLKK